MEVFELLFLLSLVQLVVSCIPTTSPDTAWSPEENDLRSSEKFESQGENRQPRRNITNIDKNPGTNRNNSDEEGSGNNGGNENDDNGVGEENIEDTGGQCINPYKNNCLTGTVRMTCASSTEAQVNELRAQIDMMWVRTVTFICPLGTSPYALTEGSMTPMQIPPVPLICSDTILDGEGEKQYRLPAGDNVMEFSCMSMI